ncbi:hypothetical protein TNCT_282851 [Trichonephila clavata]|uniref:DUF4817 domain-containing protein n=1 Tax=Trichonephila clavata TaxID=2740835 RepID=A0A8X6HXH7_TRICU|nr:hypothetical protein TNCT_282851 [Trichonephila clavata]
MDLCAKKRSFSLEHYFRTSSYKTVKERYGKKFPDSVVPHKSTIKRIVDHFQTEWTRLITKGLWPPCSPDLSSPDFFLYRHLKL